MAKNDEHREEANRKAEAAETGAREAKDSPDVAGGDTSARAPRRAPRSAPTEEKFTIGAWSQFSRQAFGVPSYVLTAVTADENGEKEYTKAELEALVKNFLDRPAE